MLAEQASVPVVLHLDHAVSEPLVDEALGLGFTSVMFDGSRLDDADNRAVTRTVAERCHAAGVRSSPSSARSAARTACTRASAHETRRGGRLRPRHGVDALAVAVGTRTR